VASARKRDLPWAIIAAQQTVGRERRERERVPTRYRRWY
jgi:hypothetical protein